MSFPQNEAGVLLNAACVHNQAKSEGDSIPSKATFPGVYPFITDIPRQSMEVHLHLLRLNLNSGGSETEPGHMAESPLS